jgi:hypothetical protein
LFFCHESETWHFLISNLPHGQFLSNPFTECSVNSFYYMIFVLSLPTKHFTSVRNFIRPSSQYEIKTQNQFKFDVAVRKKTSHKGYNKNFRLFSSFGSSFPSSSPTSYTLFPFLSSACPTLTPSLFSHSDNCRIQKLIDINDIDKRSRFMTTHWATCNCPPTTSQQATRSSRPMRTKTPTHRKQRAKKSKLSVLPQRAAKWNNLDIYSKSKDRKLHFPSPTSLTWTQIEGV